MSELLKIIIKDYFKNRKKRLEDNRMQRAMESALYGSDVINPKKYNM